MILSCTLILSSEGKIDLKQTEVQIRWMITFQNILWRETLEKENSVIDGGLADN